MTRFTIFFVFLQMLLAIVFFWYSFPIQHTNTYIFWRSPIQEQHWAVPTSFYSYLVTVDGQRLAFYFKAILKYCPTRPSMKIKERSESREIKGPSSGKIGWSLKQPKEDNEPCCNVHNTVTHKTLFLFSPFSFPTPYIFLSHICPNFSHDCIPQDVRKETEIQLLFVNRGETFKKSDCAV